MEAEKVYLQRTEPRQKAPFRRIVTGVQGRHVGEGVDGQPLDLAEQPQAGKGHFGSRPRRDSELRQAGRNDGSQGQNLGDEAVGNEWLRVHVDVQPLQGWGNFQEPADVGLARRRGDAELLPPWRKFVMDPLPLLAQDWDDLTPVWTTKQVRSLPYPWLNAWRTVKGAWLL